MILILSVTFKLRLSIRVKIFFNCFKNRMWRKNRKPHGSLCVGVDLNRNWGYRWNSEYSVNIEGHYNNQRIKYNQQ